MTPEEIRQKAVENVDQRLGYTIEFANDPKGHAYDYDLEEERLQSEAWVSGLVRSVQSLLTDDLRRPPYRGNPNPLAGHCYVASETLYHLLGGDWVPCFLRHEGAPHWYLRHVRTGEVLDPTATQFQNPPSYPLGVRKGFLTRKPSARAQRVLKALEVV